MEEEEDEGGCLGSSVLYLMYPFVIEKSVLVVRRMRNFLVWDSPLPVNLHIWKTTYTDCNVQAHVALQSNFLTTKAVIFSLSCYVYFCR